MSPNEILEIRRQSKALLEQASDLVPTHLPVTRALIEAAYLLHKSTLPWCYGCGKLLSPTDYGDHLCNGCIGGMPIGYPMES